MLFSTLAIILILTFYIISIYNSLARLKTQIQASIQEIGNQLKRQMSLIPSLQQSVKGYLKHEQSIFKMLTNTRLAVNKATGSGSAKDIQAAIDQVQQTLPKISILVEDNPELKADKTITKFMDELTDTADKLSYARRSVIDLTQTFNAKLVTFPSNMIANMFGYKSEKGLSTPLTGSHLEVLKTEMNDVKVDL